MQKNMDCLRAKKLFVLDMDGTFYLGNQLIPGSLDFMRVLKKQHKECLFFTNNSSHTDVYYRKKVQKMGLRDSEIRIYTSGDVLTYYLKKNHTGETVYLVGTISLRNSFLEQGIKIGEKDVEIVVVGFDTSLNYEKIKTASSFLRKGATFLATNPDLNCPIETGVIPDCGSICALFEAATGKKPLYMGKPFTPTLEFLVETTGYQPEEMVIVGDRLYTDIALGTKHGITSVLVLSGEAKEEDIGSVYRPDYVFSSLVDLGRVL